MKVDTHASCKQDCIKDLEHSDSVTSLSNGPNGAMFQWTGEEAKIRSSLPNNCVHHIPDILSCTAHLTLHHLQQVLASLYEGIHLSKDARLVQNPPLLGKLVMDFADIVIGLLPRVATANALLQGLPTLLNPSIKNVVQRYLTCAAFDDSAADFSQESIEPLPALVVLRVHPDDPDRAEQPW